MRWLSFLFLLTPFFAAGQSLPDSIVVVKQTHFNGYERGDVFYSTDRYAIINSERGYVLDGREVDRSAIRALLGALKDPQNNTSLFKRFGIDSNRIKFDPAGLLARFADKKKKITWNSAQKTFIYTKLSDPALFERKLREYLSYGGGYSMHQNYKSVYSIQVFTDGRAVNSLSSRSYVWGYKMPWKNEAGDSIYNFAIENAVRRVLQDGKRTGGPRTGNQLIAYLVNEIIDDNVRTLYQLSATSFKKEIDELTSDFQVVAAEENYGLGRYVKESGVMRIKLHNDRMLPNVFLFFMASREGASIYSRDSVKRDYQHYIDRIQSIRFLSNYLKKNADARLDIYYFNNKGIADYQIHQVNNDAVGWARHDKWVELLRQSEQYGLPSNFDTVQSIRNSRQNDCGCNYRFDRRYMEQAIFFELKDAAGNTSIWFLLPDNKVLLYLMDRAGIMQFNRADFGVTGYGLTYPCALFDLEGNRITR